ncbi:MAG: rRNA maturation RNase YbeY [bacterium]|nr:rRNA maturation RNase YbeY [bacterium]
MQRERLELDIKYHVDGCVEDHERIMAAADWVAEQFHLQRLVASVSIVDDPTIHRLNREYLAHDWPTDVISFVFENEAGSVEGEIIASADTANKLHQAAGWRPQDELLLYVVHGLLHLAGLDDLTPADQQDMRRFEQSCMLALEVPGADEHLQRWDDVSY